MLLLIFFACSAIRIVQQYERGVIFVLGRLTGAKGPGLFLVPPFISRMVKVDLRIVTEIAVEKNSTIIFPLPIDILEPIMETMRHYAHMPEHEPLNSSRSSEPALPR